jgi:hypothetical protein
MEYCAAKLSRWKILPRFSGHDSGTSYSRLRTTSSCMRPALSAAAAWRDFEAERGEAVGDGSRRGKARVSVGDMALSSCVDVMSGDRPWLEGEGFSDMLATSFDELLGCAIQSTRSTSHEAMRRIGFGSRQ